MEIMRFISFITSGWAANSWERKPGIFWMLMVIGLGVVVAVVVLAVGSVLVVV